MCVCRRGCCNVQLYIKCVTVFACVISISDHVRFVRPCVVELTLMIIATSSAIRMHHQTEVCCVWVWKLMITLIMCVNTGYT